MRTVIQSLQVNALLVVHIFSVPRRTSLLRVFQPRWLEVMQQLQSPCKFRWEWSRMDGLGAGVGSESLRWWWGREMQIPSYIIFMNFESRVYRYDLSRLKKNCSPINAIRLTIALQFLVVKMPTEPWNMHFSVWSKLYLVFFHKSQFFLQLPIIIIIREAFTLSSYRGILDIPFTNTTVIVTRSAFPAT